MGLRAGGAWNPDATTRHPTPFGAAAIPFFGERVRSPRALPAGGCAPLRVAADRIHRAAILSDRHPTPLAGSDRGSRFRHRRRPAARSGAGDVRRIGHRHGPGAHRPERSAESDRHRVRIGRWLARSADWRPRCGVMVHGETVPSAFAASIRLPGGKEPARKHPTWPIATGPIPEAARAYRACRCTGTGSTMACRADAQCRVAVLRAAGKCARLCQAAVDSDHLA